MSKVLQKVTAGGHGTLAQFLAKKIRKDGPIPFRDWMQSALYEPVCGYYMRRDRVRWGREGDYRTSPERTELFGATFARYFAALQQNFLNSSRFTILECGGGDGAFARAVLSNLRQYFPSVFTVTRYLIDDISEDARQRTMQSLAEFRDKVEMVSYEEMDPLNAGIVFSNELLDAFAVHRVTLLNGELRELYVSVDDADKFGWLAGDLSTSRLSDFCKNAGLQLAEGQVIDVNLSIEQFFKNIADKMISGYVVTVDYGAEAERLYDFNERPNGTLRAFSGFSFVDNVLEGPGEYDITTTVDWTYVKTIGSALGFKVRDFARQDQFLLHAGLLDELQRGLNSTASDAEKLRLSTAAREMILPGGMGSSFQVLVQTRGVIA